MDKKVLRTRVMTATVFAFIVAGSLLVGKMTSTLLLTVIGLGCTWEYLRIVKAGNFSLRFMGVIIFILVLCIFYFAGNVHSLAKYCIYLNGLAFMMFIDLLFHRMINHSKAYGIIVLFYTILPFVSGIWVLQNVANDSIFILYILILLWVSDSAAYFTGSLWGKRKLFTSISPKKTWEGFIGAGIFTFLTAVLLFYFDPGIPMYKWCLLALVVWVIGTFGDLFESSIKREFKIKDSGNFLPGHGGFLDRFDSFIFVLPFALYILFYL